jgi:hypothetical protein
MMTRTPRLSGTKRQTSPPERHQLSVKSSFRVGVDLARNAFEGEGFEREGEESVRLKLSRTKFRQLFTGLVPSRVGMEACGPSHYWRRQLKRMGHGVLLIAAAEVKPFVKRSENDPAAVCEGMSRFEMGLVPIKSSERQAMHKTREVLVKQRKVNVNALRRHAVEFGLIALKGAGRVAESLALADVSNSARICSAIMTTGEVSRQGIFAKAFGELPTFFRAVGIAVGISAGLSPANAETEDVSSQDRSISGYSSSAFPNESIMNLSIDDYDVMRTTDGLREISIPEAVWSVDIGTEVNLDSRPGDYEGLYFAIPGSQNGFYMRGWTDKFDNGAADAPLSSPIQFPVASCDAAAEGKDLVFCKVTSDVVNNTNKKTTAHEGDKNDTGAISPTDSNDNSTSSNTTYTSTQGAVQEISALAAASVNESVLEAAPTEFELGRAPTEFVLGGAPTDFVLGGSPTDFVLGGSPTDGINLSNQCDDLPTLCASISPIGIDEINSINSPALPIGSAAPPVFLPPNPVVSVGDPGLGTTPPPIASSVPEIPTGIMIAIGFSILIVVCKGVNSIKQAVIGAFSKINKKSFGHYTA